MPEMISLNKQQLEKEYENYKSSGRKLDMSRGKPSAAQLDNLSGLLTQLTKNSDCFAEDGTDCRNYGCIDGITEAKRFFAKILDVEEEDVVVCGNSSLNVMFDVISNAFAFGVRGCLPWSKQGDLKFLCPSPGYDRHFAITELFGFENIPVPMKSDGPDMDVVRKYIENDPAVKGIWCVPKYSNPTGITFSDKIVKEFAELKPAARDFIVMWDNAYAVHDFSPSSGTLASALKEAKKQNSGDMFFVFSSTSKITWPGAGISCVAASAENIKWFLKILSIRTIGYDKLAMLRHARFLNSHLNSVMEEHAKIVKEKFYLCYEYFEKLKREVAGFEFSRPNGGYFISVNVPAGKAKKVVNLAAEAGLKLTPAGATFPGGHDPEDKNIRIAPTYPTLAELEDALKLFSICVKLA